MPMKGAYRGTAALRVVGLIASYTCWLSVAIVSKRFRTPPSSFASGSAAMASELGDGDGFVAARA